MLSVVARIATLLSVLLLITACGGGSSSSSESDPDHELTGTWFGTSDLLTTAVGYGALTLEIDSDGNVTAISVDGNNQGITATQTDKESGFYVYTASNGGRFFLRREGNNLAYAAANDEVAILERGADSRPTYSISDATGTYKGTEFLVDSSYNLLAAYDEKIEANGSSDPISFENTASERDCDTNGLLNLASSTDGVYTGTFQNQNTDQCISNGVIKAYLSPDKDTVLAVSCKSFNPSDVPETCGFSIVAK